ncbi:alpha/beta fold hydrolase [Acanthopleuribacter pedis]|uniref:Alpha/beta hydrolase n=1 Tax=Acanthopleuribacter pedis TaxID=442870 RepID=A0A8J7QQ66_9BACT|nr:alpha/beta hydrolase [Acanthopleuribacter pedis]MBO1322135.1 alpha/beta hydrolase [Acanthopleuribacter pedis]
MTAPTIHYEVHGEGDRDILICNGLSQTCANWRGIARRFTAYRWILFDARGTGRSPMGPKPYHIDDHVADLTTVLDRSGADQPVLMGFSHGGRIALRAAAEIGDRFSGLVLVSTGAKQTVLRRAYVRSWYESLKRGGISAMAWTSMPTIVGRKILERFEDWELIVKGTVSRNSEEGLKALFEGMLRYPPSEEDAVRIDLPALVLRGDEDPLVRRSDHHDLVSWLPGSSEASVPETGHTLPLEEPEQFVELIDRFVATLA